ncbi:hypothetical protein [Larkinella ripae]
MKNLEKLFLIRNALLCSERIRNKTIQEDHLNEIRATVLTSTSCTEPEVVYTNRTERFWNWWTTFPVMPARVFNAGPGTYQQEGCGFSRISETSPEPVESLILD